MMKDRLFNAILTYGTRYHQEHLARNYTPDDLVRDWWKAFEFFLARACFQGRSDRVSVRVYDAAIAVLEPRVAHTNGVLTDEALVPIEGALRERIGRQKVGKGRDVTMMVSAFRFIRRLPDANDANLVAYSIARIQVGAIGSHYDELQAARSPATGITQVGAKIAAFYLRDIVSLYDLEDSVPTDFQFCLQPIDVWVRRLVQKVGMVGPDASDGDIQRAIVRECHARGYSPLQFNQGAWYAGANAYDLLLENLAAHGL